MTWSSSCCLGAPSSTVSLTWNNPPDRPMFLRACDRSVVRDEQGRSCRASASYAAALPFSRHGSTTAEERAVDISALVTKRPVAHDLTLRCERSEPRRVGTRTVSVAHASRRAFGAPQHEGGDFGVSRKTLRHAKEAIAPF